MTHAEIIAEANFLLKLYCMYYTYYVLLLYNTLKQLANTYTDECILMLLLLMWLRPVE